MLIFIVIVFIVMVFIVIEDEGREECWYLFIVIEDEGREEYWCSVYQNTWTDDFKSKSDQIEEKIKVR